MQTEALVGESSDESEGKSTVQESAVRRKGKSFIRFARRRPCCCFSIFCGISACFGAVFATVTVFSFALGLEMSGTSWIELVSHPPAPVVDRARRLVRSAEAIAADLKADPAAMSALPPDLDLVCSGGGLLSMFHLGAYSVLEALARSGRTRIHRLSGASGGAEINYRLALENDTQHVMEQNLAYGLLQETYPQAFDSSWKAALAADYNWRRLGHWLLAHYDRSRLDGVMYTSVTVLRPFPSNELVSNYDDPRRAYEAFVMTGSFFLMPAAIAELAGTYDGKLALDGGATDCAPHFKDGKRKQLITVLWKTGVENEMDILLGAYKVEEAVAAIRKGQESFAAFLRGGGLRTQNFEFKEEIDLPAFTCDGMIMSSTGVIAFSVLEVALFGALLGSCGLLCCRGLGWRWWPARWCRRQEETQGEGAPIVKGD